MFIGSTEIKYTHISVQKKTNDFTFFSTVFANNFLSLEWCSFTF